MTDIISPTEELFDWSAHFLWFIMVKFFGFALSAFILYTVVIISHYARCDTFDGFYQAISSAVTKFSVLIDISGDSLFPLTSWYNHAFYLAIYVSFEFYRRNLDFPFTEIHDGYILSKKNFRRRNEHCLVLNVIQICCC